MFSFFKGLKKDSVEVLLPSGKFDLKQVDTPFSSEISTAFISTLIVKEVSFNQEGSILSFSENQRTAKDGYVIVQPVDGTEVWIHNKNVNGRIFLNLYKKKVKEDLPSTLPLRFLGQGVEGPSVKELLAVPGGMLLAVIFGERNGRGYNLFLLNPNTGEASWINEISKDSAGQYSGTTPFLKYHDSVDGVRFVQYGKGQKSYGYDKFVHSVESIIIFSSQFIKGLPLLNVPYQSGQILEMSSVNNGLFLKIGGLLKEVGVKDSYWLLKTEVLSTGKTRGDINE